MHEHYFYAIRAMDDVAPNINPKVSPAQQQDKDTASLLMTTNEFFGLKLTWQQEGEVDGLLLSKAKQGQPAQAGKSSWQEMCW